MKAPRHGSSWFFVDESGDPTFYNRRGNFIVGKEGCSPILILGFIETRNPHPIRNAVLELQHEIVNDPYFRSVPSIRKTAVAFHAKDDVPEVRYRMFKLIASLDFTAQFIVARKVERVFQDRYQASERLFYSDLISCLFHNVLHRYEQNYIYFAKRGSRDRQVPLSNAILAAAQRFEKKSGTAVATTQHVQAQSPQGEPCLSVVDYMNWAVYRAFVLGEMRYYQTVEEKVSLLVDQYDPENHRSHYFNRRNPLDIKKITPL